MWLKHGIKLCGKKLCIYIYKKTKKEENKIKEKNI